VFSDVNEENIILKLWKFSKSNSVEGVYLRVRTVLLPSWYLALSLVS
jgi:hypothetical protein